MANDEITWDVAGQRASGQRFRTLADEHGQSHEELLTQLGGANPLPYPEFAGPYQGFVAALAGGSAETYAQLGRTGDGQAAMVATKEQAEAANETVVGDDG
ncbi:hypothetical protein GCM10022224_062560 [Nonomuraea antimicrobica]|uniref:Excreted virulence factor EspC, type VII ESX diderm n=1 Tax=Nonomuraea antimicrobica TaxID=561173 RepID=A0ABP7CDZ2_9ACTN